MENGNPKLELDPRVVDMLARIGRTQLVAALIVAHEKLAAVFSMFREQRDSDAQPMDAQRFMLTVQYALVRSLNEAAQRLLAEHGEQQQATEREPTAEEQADAAAQADAAIAKARNGGSVPGNGTVH